MKLGIVQFCPVFGDIDANVDQLSKLMFPHPEVDLWVLPELASTGYKFKNKEEALVLSETVNDSRFIDFLQNFSSKHSTLIVSGINERLGDELFNSAVLVGAEGLLGLYRKLHLFWDEKDIFEPGNLGLPVWDTSWGKLGILICFDWMFPEAWRSLALKGAQVIVHPSNLVLPYAQGVVPSYGLVNRLFVATANRVGSEEDLTFTGGSIVSNPKGEVLAIANQENPEVLIVELDLDQSLNKEITPRNHAFDDRRDDVYGNLKPC